MKSLYYSNIYFLQEFAFPVVQTISDNRYRMRKETGEGQKYRVTRKPFNKKLAVVHFSLQRIMLFYHYDCLILI